MSQHFEYPLPGFRFKVEFNDPMLTDETGGGAVVLCRGAFSECSGLEVTMEPKTIREGGRNWGAAQRMGTISFGTVILKRGLTSNADLWQWFSLVGGEGAYAQRLNVTITLFDQGGAGVFSWTLLKAIPVKFKAPDLNASNNEVVIEELHLVHEGLSRAPAAVEQL
ncbi:phage tail protein [Desulfurivibrio sp. D14AmB]|uniref:phage tail protein n=1 Tax=Desulfurivibrio sp. D14AmB TaxID=3374370 RepID=UPI00376F32B6